MKRWAGLLFGTIVSVFVSFAGCSDTNSGGSGSDLDAGTTDVDHPETTTAEDAAARYNTDGWIRLQFDADAACDFLAAPSKEKMPPKTLWESCPSVVSNTGMKCQQIKYDWPVSARGASFGGEGWADESGKVWLITNRFTTNGTYRLVIDGDGTVHNALFEPNGKRCTLGSDASINGQMLFHAIRYDENQTYRVGAIGGAIGVTPVVLESWPGSAHSYVAGPNAYFAQGPEMAIRKWAPAPPGDPLATVTWTDPGQIGQVQFQGDALFFTIGDLTHHLIKIFTVAGGTRDFITVGNTVSANAADFGTDGKDMVWVEAFGRQKELEPWPTINVMTGKFTTDPSKIDKRRLRSEAGSIGGYEFTVGCGYAAHQFASARDGVGVHLIRLSDARSWRFKQIGGEWGWTSPLAVTCDEIFMNAGHGKDYRLARVRIDSLGPGDAPD